MAVEPSEELLAYVRDLGERAAKVRRRAVSPEDDNMFKVSGDGRRAALDLRLVGLPQTTPGKIAVAADRIAAIWKAHRDDEYFDPGGLPYPVRGSLQLVFCDLGTPGPGWNAYDELRSQLAARGLPPDHVQFIHDARTDRDKARLFAACRAGRVAVLAGSTEKMGVGTNVQDRAIALHHLDAPWRPADVAQREGRILRQGNLNCEVQVIRYVTEKSFDGYIWQILERKARFISQVMHGRLDAREIADIGEAALSFSEVKAIATGNPLLIDKAEADAALARLQRAERAHLRNQDALRSAIAGYEADISRLGAVASGIGTAIEHRRETSGDAFAMVVDGTRHARRADAGQHVKHILERETAAAAGPPSRAVSIGELGGFPVTAEVSRSCGTATVTIGLDGAPGTGIELPASGLRGADAGHRAGGGNAPAITCMCEWLGVPKSGFYEWRSRPESATAKGRGKLRLLIAKAFGDSDGTYGCRRLGWQLARRGVPARPELARALMRELGLVACQPRPWRPSTKQGQAGRAYCGGMNDEKAFPVIRQTVLDTTSPRRLAEFYRQLLGLRYRPGDEPPAPGQPDPRGQDWLVLNSPDGDAALAFQKVGELPGATWPDGPVPQQLHLDTTVPTAADLDVQHERALALGARLLKDRSDDPQEPLRVYADPAGHPFCIFVG